MNASQTPAVTWKKVPTQTVTASGVTFAYRELGVGNPGTPVVCLVHLAAVLDNWDPRIIRTRRGVSVPRRLCAQGA